MIAEPITFARLKRWGTFPVPYCVSWRDGKPDFRCEDLRKCAWCLRRRHCGICGEKLGNWCLFLLTQRQIASGMVATPEPPMHEACARFALATCPFLLGGYRGDRPIPEDTVTHPDAPHLQRVPGDLRLVWCREYRVEQRREISYAYAWSLARTEAV